MLCPVEAVFPQCGHLIFLSTWIALSQIKEEVIEAISVCLFSHFPLKKTEAMEDLW